MQTMNSLSSCRLLFVVFIILFSSSSLPVIQRVYAAIGTNYPANEYEYSFNRDNLLSEEKNFEQRNTKFTEEEEIVNHYLQYLKWREFKATKENGFPPSRPIEEQLEYIQSTEVYEALVSLPKGGNMHSHENHDVSKRILLDIIWNSDDFEHLYILPPDHPTSPWTLDFFINPPEVENPAWMNVKNSSYLKETILQQQTLIGLITYNGTNDDVRRYPTDSGLRWKLIDPLWTRGSTQLIANVKIKAEYVKAMYKVGFDQGIIYFETRKNFGKFEMLYKLDPDPVYSVTNGKRFLDTNPNESGDADIDLTIELIKNFSMEHPEFIGHKRISYTYRQNSFPDFEYEMMNVARLYRKYPDHVLGFDAVGEEDAGYSTLYYLNEFLKLYDTNSKQSIVPLYLHSSETSWSDDLLASDQDEDLVATIMNSYETLLLKSKRIGHGYAFIKHPYLLKQVREMLIPIETCVVSNQLLGFSPDIRNHPAINYFRSGIPIILGADDSGTFGYDNFTVDWYQVFMSWGLDLGDLKTLALNSLQHSGLSEGDKMVAIDTKWTPMWFKYISDMHEKACKRNYTVEAISEKRMVTFSGILPKEGARTGTTNVHIFGRNFEVGICQNVLCRFGNDPSLPTKAIYVSNQHILCQAPAPEVGDQTEHTVAVYLALDTSGFHMTGLNFTYKYDRIDITTPGLPSHATQSRNLGSIIIFLMTALAVFAVR